MSEQKQCPNCGHEMETGPALLRITASDEHSCPACSFTGDTECVAAVAKLRADWQERGDRIAELTREVARLSARIAEIESMQHFKNIVRGIEEQQELHAIALSEQKENAELRAEVARLKTPGVVLEMAEGLLKAAHIGVIDLDDAVWVRLRGSLSYADRGRTLAEAYAKLTKEARRGL